MQSATTSNTVISQGRACIYARPGINNSIHWQ